MRAARYKSHSAPSFFPFLSVLVCVLGVLMFLAAGIASTSLSKATSNVEINIEGFSEHDKKPILLECTGETARTLDGSRLFTASQEEPLRQSKKFEGTPFTKFLDELSATGSNEYVLFVVRPDGIGAFEVLRDILVWRNQDRFTNSVTLAGAPKLEALAGLPKELKRRVKYKEGELSFSGAMLAADRDVLRSALDPSAWETVDRLFDKAKTAGGWVDHGVELVPAEWKFQTQAQPESQAGTRGQP